MNAELRPGNDLAELFESAETARQRDGVGEPVVHAREGRQGVGERVARAEANIRRHAGFVEAALIESDRPEFDPTHPWGCHRRRIPDRVVFDHVIAALVHGSGYERIATPGCHSTGSWGGRAPDGGTA